MGLVPLHYPFTFFVIALGVLLGIIHVVFVFNTKLVLYASLIINLKTCSFT